MPPTPDQDPAVMAAAIAAWFRAMGDETRVRILMLLKEKGELSVGALGAALGLSPPSASKQLAVLRAARIVSTRRAATTVYYSIRDQSIIQICSIVCGTLADDHRRILAGIEGAGLHSAAEREDQ